MKQITNERGTCGACIGPCRLGTAVGCLTSTAGTTIFDLRSKILTLGTAEASFTLPSLNRIFHTAKQSSFFIFHPALRRLLLSLYFVLALFSGGAQAQTYQWYCNGQLLSGETGLNLMRAEAKAGVYGYYCITSYGDRQLVGPTIVVTVKDAVAAITVTAGSITAPSSATVGTAFTVGNGESATASSGGVTYSWTVDGAAVSGTDASLSFLATSAGTYKFVRTATSTTDVLKSASTSELSVTVKDGGGTPPAAITVTAGSITAPSSATVGTAFTVNSGADATASPGEFTYSWAVNGAAVFGTGASLSFLATSAGTYKFVRKATSTTDVSESASTSALSVTVKDAVAAITVTAGSITAPSSATAGTAFTVSSGTDAEASSGEVTYSWTVDGAAVFGAGASLSFLVTSAGTYKFVRMATSVADGTKSASTSELSVTVKDAVAAITVTAGSITAPSSATAGTAFTVSSGTDAEASSGEVTYSWTVNGAAIIGAGDSLSFLATSADTYSFVRTATSVADVSKSASTSTLSVTVAAGSGGGSGDRPGDGCSDGTNTYKTVIIGSQEWMAENLRAMHKCGNSWYNGEYGRLYTWAAAMNCASSSAATPSGVRGLCPSGWHLPSDAEWTELSDYLTTAFPTIPVSAVLKSAVNDWRPYGAAGNGTDNVGFCGLPGGYCGNDGFRTNQGSYGYWWSPAESGSSNAWYRYLSYDNTALLRRGSDKADGRSIRCVKD